MGSPINVGGQYPFITFFTLPRLSGKFLLYLVSNFNLKCGKAKKQHNRNLPLSLGGKVKNVMKGYCPPTLMGLPITLITHLFLVYKLMKLYDVT